MGEEDVRTEEQAGTIAEVDRIRDIIFGAQMRGYEQQFKRVNSQLDLLGKQLEGLQAALNEQRDSQESRTRKLEEETGKRYAELDRTVSSQLEQLGARLDQQLADLVAESRQLKEEMRKQAQDLRSELRNGLQSLEDDKAGRQDLGDLLLEMGTRLKQQMGLGDLLGQLEEAAKDSSAE